MGNIGRKKPRHFVANQSARRKPLLALRKPKNTRKARYRTSGSPDCQVAQKSTTPLTMAMLSCKCR
jgi:hypothetical protein